ncbi:MAG: N-formylglutamate amidohydrolase [Cyanobacteria bacterium J06639_16]
MNKIFVLESPTTQALPILANLPHSGLFVPDAIRQQLTEAHQAFLPNQDWHLDRLYDFLPALGISTLQATHSRYVVDLNRSLKPPYFGDFWSSVIPNQTAFKVPLYQTLPSSEALKQRLQDYYLPYHAQLAHQLSQMIQRFGRVYLLDLHSFYGLITDDVCLGNAKGKTCSERLVASVERAFVGRGYGVVRNKAFTGGYITRHYGNLPNIEALQIEVRYPVYLDENRLDELTIPDWKVAKFEAAKQQFRIGFEQFIDQIFQRTPD